MELRKFVSCLFSLILGVVFFATAAATNLFADGPANSQADRAADAAAIRAHIESIFQAFIDGNIDKIYATHSQDWRGFLEGSRVPIKGIDEYMRANGFEWPRPANAPKSTPNYPAGTGYKMSDFDVNFYGPELAVASFVGEFNRKMDNTTITLRRFRIMDVYAKRKGGWIQLRLTPWSIRPGGRSKCRSPWPLHLRSVSKYSR